VSVELVVNGAAVWECCDNHYVGFVPCVIVAVTEKRVKVAVMLSNGKLGMRYVGKRDLVPVECHREESVILNIRCDLKLREQKQ
jgi:hypothetical protein